VIQNEHTFQNKDETTLFYHEWLPDDNNIRAVVFIVHGIGEHSGRYRHVAESFTQAGFACYGIDHRGHGKSEGLRSYFTDIGDVVDDFHQLFEMIREQYSDKTILIYGHSMGSLVSLEFTLQYQQDIKALALTGTAITGEELQPSWLVALAQQAAKIIPKVRLSPSSSADILTTDAEQVQLWEADPLTDKGMWRIGSSVAMLNAGHSIQERAHQLTLPILAMHGGADELVPSSGATYLKDHVQSNDITIKIYPRLRHELVNEIGRDAIIKEITDWLVAHS
jgi:alpha-beta hydrolase superfamily lysophospholipase